MASDVTKKRPSVRPKLSECFISVSKTHRSQGSESQETKQDPCLLGGRKQKCVWLSTGPRSENQTPSNRKGVQDLAPSIDLSRNTYAFALQATNGKYFQKYKIIIIQ